ncbi:hypothetical protein BCR35DRAFT_309834 [Leucosporidium creatinivorum]|uniref:DNA repair protein REV1 n=1 Tax=Leucosporidium creatinivorum TaxID=106004 RepID=A0A1Y2DAZ0_9BASI|nr:hypothetical protein BCR35DRAFT_309834 [Leucosporidium creatinivorum]
MAQPSGLDSFDAFLVSDDGFEESLLALDEPPSVNLNALASSSKRVAEESKQDYRDDAAYEITGFGEGGKYLRNKRKKLAHQRQDLLEQDGVQRPQLFKGDSIYINGYTEGITQPELANLIVLHGGEYVPYLDALGLVTHIIASTLTPSKRKELQDKKYKVATPSWITDSVKAGRRLDWRDYSLFAAKVRPEPEGLFAFDDGLGRLGTQSAQKSLFSMGVARGAVPSTPAKAQGQQKVSAMATAKPSTSAMKAAGESNAAVKIKDNTETIESLSERGVRLAQDALRAAETKRSIFQPRPNPAPRPLTPTSLAKDRPSEPRSPATTDSPHAPTKQSRKWLPDADKSEKTLALLNDPGWMAKHTSAAPDFLQKYFSQSRLHHLSTWKEELKELVASLQPSSAQPIRSKKLSGTPKDGRIIFHVDFDCFFVSAGLTTRPELRGKAVAVCHSRGGEEAASSTSEISSCSYEARAKGVKSGISLGRAREMCPELVTIPFEFDLYKSIASRFYEILLSHASLLQAVSIDEVLMEVKLPSPSSPTSSSDPALELAHRIRAEILSATGCPASIGISHNILLARLASRKAKPANAFHLTSDLVPSFLNPLSVDDLPGIGWSTRSKLEDELRVTTVGDLLKVRQSELVRVLGEKQGKKFAEFARGVDDRELDVGKARQSVSTEVNYAIRFENEEQVERFLRQLGEETVKRLRDTGCKARSLNLKIMQRHPDSPLDPPKFLGHGHCLTQTSSDRIAGPGGSATDDGTVVGEVAWTLLRRMKIEPRELRGIGIQLQKLEKDGRSVDAVREKGQSTLSFAAAPRPPPPPPPAKPSKSTERTRPSPPREHEPSPSPLETILPPPAQQLPSTRRSLRKDPSIIILSDSNSDSSSPPPAKKSSAPIVKPFSIKKERPSEYIPSLFNRRKRAAPPTPPSTQQVPDSELIHYGIDPEIYHALPRDVQSEQLATARKSKFAPKPEKRQTTLKGRSSKAALSKERSKSKSKSTTPPPPPSAIDLTISPSSSPAGPPLRPPPAPISTFLTDDELNLLDWDIFDFRSFSSSFRKQLTSEGREQLKQQASLTVKSHRRAPRDAGAQRAGLREVEVRHSARFMHRVELEDIRDVLEEWVQEMKDQGPPDSDLTKLAKYLEKCVSRDKECDLAKAMDVLEWWEYLLLEECGREAEAEGSARVWWDALARMRSRVQDAVRVAYGTTLLV